MSPDRPTFRAPIRRRATPAAAAALILLLIPTLGALATPPASASGYHDDTECDPGATQMLAGAGGDSGQLMKYQECSDNSKWVTEATFYKTDATKIIWEPRDAKLDFSTTSSIDPFAGLGYVYSKARELFPLSDGWPAVTQYAADALTAKPRAIASRENLDPQNSCSVYPRRFSDETIRANQGWLPPEPTPDGKTGYITYDLDPGLTSQQRAVILTGLIAYDDTRQGTSLPAITLWTPGSDSPPTMHFDPGKTFPDGTAAYVHGNHFSRGRDGLLQWKDGNIEILSGETNYFSGIAVLHEILHVEGFDHVAGPGGQQAMSPNLGRARSPWAVQSIWGPDGPVVPYKNDTDPCTKYGVSLAK